MSSVNPTGCIVRTQTTEGTDLKTSNYFRSKQMAKVTYRGVQYDTEEYTAMILEEDQKRQRHDLMYRGLKVRSNKAKPCS